MKRVVTIVAVGAIAASVSFGQTTEELLASCKPRLMGQLLMCGGAWNMEPDSPIRLTQTDASAWFTMAVTPRGIPGMAEYSFDVSYVGGLEDNAIGFGVIVPGFLMGVVWDPANLGGSGLRAQVYNQDAALHQYAGITYDVEVPSSVVTRVTAETVMNTPLTVRIRVDSTSGDVWVKDPFDATTWWAFSLGQSLEDAGHNMIGVGTAGMAASFDNFSAIPIGN